MTPLNLPPIAEVATGIKDAAFTVQSLVERCLDTIAERDPELNAFITVLADTAREEAGRADAEIAAGRHRGPLHGIPVSVKDLIDIEGLPTTAASRVRAGHVASADAPVVARLRAAGAIVVGKCNLHEFAFGTTGEDSAYGPTRNPHAPDRSPGGSSGGSAVSVATGMALASVGTDTGGSIRIPAAACGVVGLKPTFGEVSCDGVVPLAHSLDHVGPITRTAADAALIYRVLRDAPDAGHPPPGARRTMTVGIPRRYFLELLDPEVQARFDEVIGRLAGAGCAVTDIDIPHAADTGPVYLHTVLAEAAALHAHTLETRPEDYTEGVRLRLEIGRYVLAEDYARAQRGRAVLRREVDEALARCDTLLMPTLPIPAPPLGAATMTIGDVTEDVRALTLRLTQLFDLTGHPAITLPSGRTADGLPCGVQLVGRWGHTLELLELAAAYEPDVFLRSS